MAEKKQPIRAALESDEDPSKINALKKLREIIGENEIKIMRQELIKEFMEKTGDELWKMTVETEESLGIKDRITEREL